MKLEYWKQFENSGRIEDYLSFVACERQGEKEWKGWLQKQEDAGKNQCNGNYLKADTGGGIRQTY